MKPLHFQDPDDVATAPREAEPDMSDLCDFCESRPAKITIAPKQMCFACLQQRITSVDPTDTILILAAPLDELASNIDSQLLEKLGHEKAIALMPDPRGKANE